MIGFLLALAAAAMFAFQNNLDVSRSPRRHASFARRAETIVNAFSVPSIVRIPPPHILLSRPLSTFELERHMNLQQLLDRWNPLIAEASRRFGVPAAWIRVVVRVESGGRTMASESRPIISKAGAEGLMQLMPATYKEIRKKQHLGANPFNPHDNIFAGAAYLHWLHDKYGYPAMFAAYNAGPGKFLAHRKTGQALPGETRHYVEKISAVLGAGGSKLQTGLAKLTRPNGKPVWIESDAVASVRAALPGEYAGAVKSVIAVGKTRQGVRETVGKAEAALRKHGGFQLTASLMAPAPRGGKEP